MKIDKHIGRGMEIDMNEFIIKNWLPISEAVAEEIKIEMPKLLKEIENSNLDFDEFYDKYFGYKEHSTSVTDFYNKMKNFGLW